MIKLNSMCNGSSIRVRLALTCAASVLAACSQGGSNSSTANTAGAAMDNSLADAPPPATALPLASGPAPASSPGRAATALPPAPSAPLGQTPPGDQYAYLNQAYDFSQSLADAPPDYTYDYQGEQPWVWQSPDGYYRLAERLPMGVRYFYYAPGASTPYLVQDPQYSYAYSQGYLAAVYGPNGEAAPYDVEARQARAAGAYLAWAVGLYAAARHDEHVAVSVARWGAERQAVYADQARWIAARQHNTAWANYGRTHQNDEAHWADQRYVRAAEAARFAQAVHDETALAHAQQAAEQARVIAQTHAERPPGPAPKSAVLRREGDNAAGPAAGLAAVGLADRHQPAVQRQTPEGERADAGDQAATRARVDAEPQRRSAVQRAAETRSPHEAEAARHPAPAPPREAEPRDQQPLAHQAEAAQAAQHAGAERAADSHRQAADQAAAQARAQNDTQAAEAHRAAQPQAHEAPRPATEPAKPPARPPGKPKPDEPHT